MRYIGSKKNMISKIASVIQREITDSPKSFLDIFAGTGIVGESFKGDYQILANDYMYFSYVLLEAKIRNNKAPGFAGLQAVGIADPLTYLTVTPPQINESYFITRNYAPYEGNERMYFTIDNAGRIDFTRQTIEGWKAEGLITTGEYFYLLACLVEAVPFVSNISGTYGAYLKHWDKRALSPLKLEHLNLLDNGEHNLVFHEDALSLSRFVTADICYIDPPYNGRQYPSNYHILETVARYDSPEITGVTGIRASSKAESSLFCKKGTVKQAFDQLIRQLKCRHILVSYSSEGLLSRDEICAILSAHGLEHTLKVYDFPYRKYKSKVKTAHDNLFEYIFYIQKDAKAGEAAAQKKQNASYSVAKGTGELIASPLNYIGGKYKLLPQLLEHFPKQIGTFVDLFAGGLNVGVNLPARRVIANDINNYVIELLQLIRDLPAEELIGRVERIIAQYNLTTTNETGYLALRDDYNAGKDPVLLYALLCFSFNYQLRFNNNHQFNNPFGRNRSQFSDKLKQKLIKFSARLKEKDIVFLSKPFDTALEGYRLNGDDFVYCDPPYLITTGSYNDGNRGFKGWRQADELALFALLDRLDSQGIPFALSNVLQHKGAFNQQLYHWSKRYRVIHLSNSYSNSSYNTKREGSAEVLVVNY